MKLRSKHAVGSSLMDAFEAIMRSVPEILVTDLAHPFDVGGWKTLSIRNI